MSSPEVNSLISASADERTVLVTLALAATTMPRSHLVAVLKGAGKRHTKGSGYNNDNLGALLKQMHDRKLIDFSSGVAHVTLEVTWAVLLGEPRPALETLIAALRAHYPHAPQARDALARELNLALLDRDADELGRLIGWSGAHQPFALARGKCGVLGDLPALVVEHVRSTPQVHALVIAEQLRVARDEMRGDDEDLALIEALSAAHRLPMIAAHELCRHLILRGRLDDAAALCERHLPPDDDTRVELECWIAVARRETLGPEQLKRALSSPRRSAAESVPAMLPGPERVMVELVRIARRLPAAHADASGVHGLLRTCAEYFVLLESALTGCELELWRVQSLYSYGATPEQHAWQAVCAGLLGCVAPDFVAPHSQRANRRALAAAAGHTWLADELAPLSDKRELATSLYTLFSPAPAWQRKLERLEKALPSLRPTVTAASHTQPLREADTRLVWMFEVAYARQVSAHPREQRRDTRGNWSKGRRVALEHLHGVRPAYTPLTPADLAVCAFIREDVVVERGYRNVSYSLDEAAAFEAFAAHPHVYMLDDDTQRVVFRNAEPSLHVVRAADGFDLRLEPRVRAAGDYVHKTGPLEVTRLRASALHERLGELLGDGLSVPASQADRVAGIVAAVTGLVAIHSDLGTDAATAASGQAGQAGQAEQVAADARTIVQLTPAAGGLSVRMRVRPLGAEGPGLVPGDGARTLSASRGGRTILAQRDLALELARVDEVMAACPALLLGEATTGGGWQLSDSADGLELLIQLEALGDAVIVEWPAGKPLKVVGSADAKALRLKIGAGAGGWFALSGELVVADGHTIEIGELLRLIADSPHRFVALSPERFVALTARLRDQLARLAQVAALAEPRRGHVGLHPWAAEVLEPLAEEAGAVTAVAAWRKRVAERAEAARFVPVVPSTLKATLRDYQRDGFCWMARLARLGVGACLADDMGLGKTLQALALLVHRAAEGPQLVVCPTSVIGGWLEEAARFAPTLRLAVLGAPDDRARAVSEAGPFDVLVVSYGLLQVESKLLATRRWETVVLDEAQAIKNAETQRASAAYSLDAAFRVALTGTPIENRLEDLWALFNFLVPGLLGSRMRFVARYVRPEAEGRQARLALKQIIGPLLLRRTKAEVLEELPTRTEMVLRVSLSPREAALYVALRERALTSLAAHAAEPSGQRRVRVLAELTRLRRACCHPRLVLPNLADAAEAESFPDTAKLTAFGELVQELRQGGHRALVYSQFVDHLEIVREWLDGQAIHYQYLDGSTPQKQRQERVHAFQAGDGELFLISLRAGGTGLNLTGADFVIHLDPWWNPAVEDQASDRVYRIGQERPVTIVRLVVRGSIEERILELHRTKRELADDLLAGSEAAAHLDVDGLVALLAGPEDPDV